MSELAIAAVPIQEWEKPYDMEKAFQNGNIFPALHKPFFIEEKMTKTPPPPSDECEEKLLQIQQTGFFLTDLSLFLDTHPGHREAEEMKQQLLKEKKKLTENFAMEHFPLTLECPGSQDNMRIPWEGGKKNVAL